MPIEPPEELPEHWHSEFRGQYRKCIIPKFKNFNEQERRDDLRDEIRKQASHRELVNLCVFPFSQQSEPPGGYHLVKLDPLEECGVKNFDFLLHDLDGHIILGEAKAHVPQQVDRLINEVIEERAVVKEHKQYIEENYLGTEIIHQDHVLACFSNRSDEITRKILGMGENIVTWKIDPTHDALSINESLPSEVPEHVEDDSLEDAFETLRQQIQHAMPRLNSSLSQATTSKGAFDIFPRSGFPDRLRTIITASRSEGRYVFLNRVDIREVVQADFINERAGMIDEFVNEIIEEAKSIGFLEEWDDERAQLKVVSRYTESDGLEETMKKKWIDSRIKAAKDELRAECEEQATREVGRQTQIGDFDIR